MELRLLFLQIQVGIAVLIILLMRVGMRKLPRVYSYMLWLVVFARLLFPVFFESRFGWMPSTAEGIQWLEENLGRIHSAAERHSADSGDGVTIGGEDHASGEKIEVSSGTDTGYMTEGVAADSHTGSGHMPEEAAEAGSNGNTDQGTKDVTGTDSNADTLGIPLVLYAFIQNLGAYLQAYASCFYHLFSVRRNRFFQSPIYWEQKKSNQHTA
ncbi:MAG: hypothetical protein K2O97_00655 [Acetatifactor sp.]|jgi:BlaR1 peptidase M56.|nr:hypothetical protein [Acetatifactor sp.]MDE7043532.1 hypothetical protein [Acetatifactor sp.]